VISHIDIAIPYAIISRIPKGVRKTIRGEIADKAGEIADKAGEIADNLLNTNPVENKII
jgi:hypothetical protein